jgi:hypothetical protein
VKCNFGGYQSVITPTLHIYEVQIEFIKFEEKMAYYIIELGNDLKYRSHLSLMIFYLGILNKIQGELISESVVR